MSFGSQSQPIQMEIISSQNTNNYQLLPGEDISQIYPVVIDTLRKLNIEVLDLVALDIPLKPLNDIITKELSKSRHLTWASIDNFIEKMVQGLVISKGDLNNNEKTCCKDVLKQMLRQMPHGRSLLLQDDWGLRKVSASRGFVKSTESTVGNAVSLFIGTALSYRLIELMRTGTSDFGEFTGIFKNNSQRGVTSLVRMLAKLDPIWLQLLIASPFILGLMKGVVEGCKSQQSPQRDLADLQFAVKDHTRTLTGLNSTIVAYLWEDSAKQILPIPCITTITERMQKAERFIRWNGTVLLSKQRLEFDSIKLVAYKGRGMSKMYAMQCLAKIIHSLSINDFAAFQSAGISKDRLMQIIQLKAEALDGLKILAGNELPAEKEANIIQRSMASSLYACYLLWWLGQNPSTTQNVGFSAFKAGKLALTVAFIKEIVDSILQAINCPDKPGFKMFYGDFEIWANKLTAECFNEFVRQFRLVSIDEPIEPFLEQLENFHLDGVESLKLFGKGLTANETQAILKILNPKMTLKDIDLGKNDIGEDVGIIDFPETLLNLRLDYNHIGPKGAKEIRLPKKLELLKLTLNFIQTQGFRDLKLPDSIKFLDLAVNKIQSDGLTEIHLLSSLETLNLNGNNLGLGGLKKIKWPSKLKSLNLMSNSLEDQNLMDLDLPLSIIEIGLAFNEISDEGFNNLKLPPQIEILDFDFNKITENGLKGRQLPSSLKEFRISDNKIGPNIKGWVLPKALSKLDIRNNQLGNGVRDLNLSLSLQVLFLNDNNIDKDGLKGLKLPSSLKVLVLDFNNIGNEGVYNLDLPKGLESLSLANTGLTAEVLSNLKLHEGLTDLDLGYNKLGPKGIKNLKLPLTLKTLILEYTELGNEGCKDLILNSALTRLGLSGNNIDAEGIIVLNLPEFLERLQLSDNGIGNRTKSLKIPAKLKFLDMSNNQIDNEGAKNLDIPLTINFLSLQHNLIGDRGILEVLKKIYRTNIRNFFVNGNLFNSTILNSQRILEQGSLLKNCQDKLCHSNTQLLDTEDTILEELQTSGAMHTTTPFSFLRHSFDWLKMPIEGIVKHVDVYFKSRVDIVIAKLSDALSDSPSYFPNIGSPVLHDFHSPGPLFSEDVLQSIKGTTVPLYLAAPSTMSLMPYSTPTQSLWY
ncbi:MAG: hypothetical protein H0W88_00735 [Parachlamydiaceae bacterium]|nr:hypothetical protein [Parachlamydiaceae bacterium]